MSDFEDIYSEDNAKKFSSIGNTKIEFVDVGELIDNRKASKVQFSDSELVSIENNFHELMRYRCRNADSCLLWLNQHTDELPKVTNDLLTNSETQWFPIPGMYGGFAYGLLERAGKPVLITDSWVRVVGGSGEQHEITPDKVELKARGFA